MRTLALTVLMVLIATVAIAGEIMTYEVVDGKGKITRTYTDVQVQENLSLEDMSRRLSDLEREKVNIANETIEVKKRNDARIVEIDKKITNIKTALKQMPAIVDEIN